MPSYIYIHIYIYVHTFHGFQRVSPRQWDMRQVINTETYKLTVSSTITLYKEYYKSSLHKKLSYRVRGVSP